MGHLVVVKREAMPDHIHGDNRELVQVAHRGQIERGRITRRVPEQPTGGLLTQSEVPPSPSCIKMGYETHHYPQNAG